MNFVLDAPERFWQQRRVLLPLLTLIGAAAFLRYWQLYSLPPGLWFDQAYADRVALEILHGKRYPVYTTDLTGFNVGLYWLTAAWAWLFGFNEHVPRNITALTGVFSIAIEFLSVREIFTAHARKDALAGLSALFLTFSLWHLQWSRTGVEVILLLPFAIGVPLFLIYGWRTQQLWAGALAGVFLGLSQYTYTAARFLPFQTLLLFGGWLFLSGVDLRSLHVRRLFVFVTIFGLAGLAASAPLGWFFFNNPELLVMRVWAVSDGSGLAGYLKNFYKMVLALNMPGAGDMNSRHNLPGRPVFDLFASFWMWLGVGWLVVHKEKWKSSFLVLTGALLGLFPAVLSQDSPHYGRAISALPFLVILPAVGIITFWEWQTKLWIRLPVLLSIVLSCGLTLRDYFLLYPSFPGVYEDFQTGWWTLTHEANLGAQKGVGYLLVNSGVENIYPGVAASREWSPGDLRVVITENCRVYPVRGAAQTTVIAASPDWVETIKAQYPTVLTKRVSNPRGDQWFGSIFYLSSEEVSLSGAAPAMAIFGEAFELLKVDLPNELTRQQPVNLMIRWRTKSPLLKRYTVFIHFATPEVPRVEGLDGEPCRGGYDTSQWRAGDVVEQNTSFTLPLSMPAGDFDLMLGMYETLSGEVLPATPINQSEVQRLFVKHLTVR